MTLNRGWLRCRAALESAVRIDAMRSDAWLAANEQATIQALNTRARMRSDERFGVLLGDIIERNVGLHANSRLPDPPNDTAHYKHWLRANCFRLSERLRALGDGIDTFSWLRREYLREHGRLVK